MVFSRRLLSGLAAVFLVLLLAGPSIAHAAPDPTPTPTTSVSTTANPNGSSDPSATADVDDGDEADLPDAVVNDNSTLFVLLGAGCVALIAALVVLLKK